MSLRQSSLDIELEAPPRCENQSCTKVDGTKCITWRSLSNLSDFGNDSEMETPLLSRWLASQDKSGDLADESISMGLRSPYSTTAFHSTDSYLSSKNVGEPTMASISSPKLQPTTPITISSLLSPKDTPANYRNHDTQTFPYSKIIDPPRVTDEADTKADNSANLLSPRSCGGPVRTRPKSRGRKRPTTFKPILNS